VSKKDDAKKAPGKKAASKQGSGASGGAKKAAGTKKDADKKVDTKHCVSCRNFDADKKGGWCRHHDKKRSAQDKTCGSYKKR